LNAGDENAMAQAQHGSAPGIAGKGIANPISLVLSAGMLLGWLGDRHDRAEYRDATAAIDTAVDAVLMDETLRTPDLGGTSLTADITKRLCGELEG
jgi:3-isopropylmalate dehydrogenase